MSEAAEPSKLSDAPRRITVMGVEYRHIALPDGDDLYLTEYGLPFSEELLPHNHHSDEDWYRTHHVALNGTSSVYRVQTKPVNDRSLDIVFKWNRMGQDIPGATQADDLTTAEFNSPFEEFALMLELRAASPGRIYTHRPLAIYVPGRPVEWDRSGRRRYKFEAKQKAHTDLPLHADRSYAVLYEWIKGIDAADAFGEGLIDQKEMASLTISVADEMHTSGFVVRDNKPHHIIVRPEGKDIRRDREGRPIWAYVDFELLQRTEAREHDVRQAKRKAYLVKQAQRFQAKAAFPAHLQPVHILDVEYVYGRTENTGGALWVVGKDPDLFDYFRPERWRKTPRIRQSASAEVYETTTKDNVRLVWRVSAVGQRLDMDPFRTSEKRICDYGYNSPFEEIALAMHLAESGIQTIYPRAIYMTGDVSTVAMHASDHRRYDTHSSLQTPEGESILQKNREYIILWGYWNGPDELLAVRDEPPYTSITALQAYHDGLLDEASYLHLMDRTHRRLEQIGVEDLNLRGTHLLVSLRASGQLERDPQGEFLVLVCNFELLRYRDAKAF